MPTVMFYVYPSMVLLLAHHQLLCYCSLAQPEPRKRSKSLVSQDYSYGIVFVDKNVMQKLVLNLSFYFASIFICALNPRSHSHNLSSNLP